MDSPVVGADFRRECQTGRRKNGSLIPLKPSDEGGWLQGRRVLAVPGELLNHPDKVMMASREARPHRAW
ncbi:MAG: hypothetical protein LBV40_04870 [Methanomicrobiales archaeon]|nr:hypothetical protein [Methanomicrobiales archaeon]